MTTVVPVVLIIMGIGLNVLVVAKKSRFLGVGASPALANLESVLSPDIDSLSADQVFGTGFDVASDSDVTAGFVVVDGDSLLNAGNPLSTILPTRDGLLVYKVQKGDTLSKIAANFGISLNTIFWANSSVGNSIRPGQELVVLPVTGVLHQIEEGETVDSISEFYSVTPEKIRQFNKIAPAGLKIGSSLVIPGAKPKKTFASASLADLPNYPGYFILPTTGWNWGKLHYYNGVDIANACGTPIYASAEGLVVREKVSGWNDGYGGFVEIEHPNGVVSKYSHTQKNLVSIGDYVLQGDIIAHIGNTGNVHGPTGCHLHFELRGARNPFAK
ncbi:MAG: Peptidase M23 [Parcubacteria group bacterium Gr01-1014_19]|nr:MAG: Peptidase M23 [Parcubacteria group bacterium Gr01-1014_19]